MVQLDVAADGLITLRFHQPYAEGDEEAYLAALDRIGAVDRPFVLLAIFGGGPGLSQAGERQQALWFKATRERMQALCRGLAMVRPGASERMADTFRRLWSFPLMVTADEADARAFLAPLVPTS